MFVSAIICILGILIVIISTLLLFISLFLRDNKEKMLNLSAKLIIFGLIVGMVGFGTCFYTFTNGSWN